MVGVVKSQKKDTLLSHTVSVLVENKLRILITMGIFAIIYTFLYGLWKIPIIQFGINRTSEVGFVNYLFVFVISILMSVFIVLWKHERKHKITSASSVGSTGGGFAGVVSAICPVCQSIGIVGLGSTLLNIPTAFLTPYLGILMILSVGILVLAVVLKADSIYTKSCRSCVITTKRKTNSIVKESVLYKNNFIFGGLIILVFLVSINQILIPKAYASSQNYGNANLGSFEYGSKITLKPMPLSTGEAPRISGYKTIVKPLPTISELQITSPTGDAVQDLLNNIVPRGMPWYGEQASVNFDDPIASQKQWANYRSLQLSLQEQERWSRIANSFTCDYCCGSPQNPTIITRCGCAHSAAAQGMAKWFIKNYGDSYSDEEIYGEMARWYALWYPKGTIERIIQESQL